MAHIILFDHSNFRGAHKHVFDAESNLASSDDSFFNDRVSSFIILEGTWVLFRDINFTGPASQALGPGKYDVFEIISGSSTMSSLKSI